MPYLRLLTNARVIESLLEGREKVITEQARADGENEVTLSRSGGVLAANLQIGADTTAAVALDSNRRLSSMGVKLHRHRKRQQEQHPGLTLTGNMLAHHIQALAATPPASTKVISMPTKQTSSKKI